MARAENRPASRAGNRRRFIALGGLLLVGSLAVAGCSSNSSKPGAHASTGGAGSAGSSTSSPSAVATASGSAGPVTAASLSDSRLGYTVTSIPAGLDVTQVKVLQDFVAYDQVTWRLWVSGGQDTSKVPTVTTGTFQVMLLDRSSTVTSRTARGRVMSRDSA